MCDRIWAKSHNESEGYDTNSTENIMKIVWQFLTKPAERLQAVIVLPQSTSEDDSNLWYSSIFPAMVGAGPETWSSQLA